MFKILVPILLLALASGCKQPEARKPISETSGSFIKESIARNKKLYEEQKAKIESIIANSPNTEYITSQSGFWYTYKIKVENNNLKTPQFGDIVNFNFSISDLDNNEIYSKEQLKTRDYAMDKQEIFTGLREGLKLMKAGESVTFIFPSQKAYGYYGDENKIGTNVPIICNITVNSIIKK